MSPEDIAAFRARLDQQVGDDYVRGPSPKEDARMADFDAKVRGTAEPSPSMFDEVVRRWNKYGPAPGTVDMALGPQAALGLGESIIKRNNGARPSLEQAIPAPSEAPPVALQPMVSQDPTLPNTPTPSPASAPPRGGLQGGGSQGPALGGMGGPAADYKRAQQNQLGAYNTERDLVEHGAEIQTSVMEQRAQAEELLAARKQRDAEVMAQHQAQVAQKHEAFLARNQQLSDDIAAHQIDPSKVMGDKSAGEKVMMMIAGLLSGAAGQGPQFMQRLDNMVETGVKAQMANVDNKKAALSARQNLFGQMMAESGDRQVAEAQTRNLIYESIKQDIAARAERLNIPSVKNNAELAMNEIEQKKQNPLQQQIAADALHAQQQAAAANAAAQIHAEDKAWSRGKDTFEMGLKKGQLDLERDKFDAEKGAGAGGLNKAGRDKLETETATTQRELDAALHGIAKHDPKTVAAGSTIGSVLQHLPTFVPGVGTARENAIKREEYAAMVRPLVGAAWHWRTGFGEPKNAAILDEQAQAFTPGASDNDEVISQKQDALRRHLIESAEAQGARLGALPGSVKFGQGAGK